MGDNRTIIKYKTISKKEKYICNLGITQVILLLSCYIENKNEIIDESDYYKKLFRLHIFRDQIIGGISKNVNQQNHKRYMNKINKIKFETHLDNWNKNELIAKNENIYGKTEDTNKTNY